MAHIKRGRFIIPITNQDKILFPEDQITKGDIISYYDRIAPYMLPFLKNRLLTMQRYPEGIDKPFFFQKDASNYFPHWIKTKAVEKKNGEFTNYVICQNQATLLYLANQACLTPHLWLSTEQKLNYPKYMIFDLDPAPGQNFDIVRQTALVFRQLLTAYELTAFPLLTGSRGIHVTIPLDQKADFELVKGVAQQLAELLIKDNPKQLTLEVRKDKRANRLFIDTLRNEFAQTAVAPYAIRAHPHAPVAAPIDWKEVHDKKLTSARYTIRTIFDRLETFGDPWANIGDFKGSALKVQKILTKLK